MNFLENLDAKAILQQEKSSDDILLRISGLTDVPMVPGKTWIFFDEVQECKELVTAIKFLVERSGRGTACLLCTGTDNTAPVV